ncbi:MAG TPA: hypothetical protein VJP45_11435 [Candidatus Limnocylindria bacterium]|nr:hypothetical protein [Candidatus Limnocylindria bacterium]
MGGLVRFPRAGARRGEDWQDRESSPQVKRPVATLVTWSELKTLHDGDDNGDGGGRAA